MGLTVTDTFRYPIKSCRGERLARADVEPWGLAGDRRWMLVGADGEAVTAREHPQLVLVTPQLDGGLLRVSRPGADELEVKYPDGSALAQVSVWRTGLLAATAEDDAHEWFSQAIGRQVRLVYLDDPARRRPSPDHSRPEDRVSFADGYPLLLTTTQSLDALNDLIAAGPNGDEAPLPVTRFRPNVVVTGAPAWAEDKWRRIRIGSIEFRNAKGCARCVLTTVDPETAVKGREPLITLARHRRWDGGLWFGINLIPDGVGAICVGDPVEVLE